MKSENFEALRTALDRYLAENIPAEAYLPKAQYDLSAELRDFTEPFVRALNALEPTGCCNPEPMFRAEVSLLEARAIGTQGAHLRLIVAEDGIRRTGIWFGAGDKAAELSGSAEILFTPQLNTWNGRTDVQLRLCALRDNDLSVRFLSAKSQESHLLRDFLTNIVYNGEIISSNVPILSFAQFQERCAANPQGLLVICADADAAQRIIEVVKPSPMDFSVGRIPGDPRAFNVVTVCPTPLTALPLGFREVIFAGAPPLSFEGAAAFRLEGMPIQFDLPSVDDMREVYRACLYLVRRPAHLPDIEALIARLCAESGVSPLACHLSLLALEDMRLIKLREKPLSVYLPPMKKTDPESSAVWRAIRSIAEGRD